MVFLDGRLNVYDVEISSSFDIQVDAEEHIGILWEEESNRFVISIPELQNIDLDFEMEDIEELENLGIEIQTEHGTWNCFLIDQICSSPNNESIEWL